jgi:hypothetical protein
MCLVYLMGQLFYILSEAKIIKLLDFYFIFNRSFL